MITHLACIMDGNRRWAQERGLHPWEGHQYGAKALQKVVQFCLEQNIAILSIYALSMQNLKRTEQEVSFLFSLFIAEANSLKSFLHKQNICVRFKGEKNAWPQDVFNTFEVLEKETSSYTRMQLNILICYGAQEEIVAATKKIALQVKEGTMSIESITKDTFAAQLWVYESPPDLIIRTGKEFRLSNFLLYQSAYSELYFLDLYWPDITKEHLQDAFAWFMQRKRRFGV